ncbi:MAG: late competence development ComFB family protein [Selenomonadaceae bacterium]|nr:late competence development ComFB family protein [Selenomonadaceae bacterium]
MEVVVENKLGEVLSQYPNCCTCDTCKQDIAVIALNHLKPRYVSTEKGQIFARIEETNISAEVEVLRQLVEAVKIVSAHPRHER